MSKLYERISSLCAQRGIKPGKMCSDLGISRGNISDLKMGRIESLSVEKLSKISAYFDVSIDYLLDKEKAPPQEKRSEVSGWYSPLRFWDKINHDRNRFMHYFLQSWEYPIETIGNSWGIPADDPDAASESKFRQFVVDTVKAVRFNGEDGEWDIVMYPQKEKTPTLTEKDRRDIARDLERLMADLDTAGDLQFDGDPMSDEARESIKAAMKLGLEAAKLKNKERFTPKKYRKG